MECFNLIYAHLSVQYLDILTLYLVNIPEPVQYDIYTLAFPFDLRCESVTYIFGTLVLNQTMSCKSGF